MTLDHAVALSLIPDLPRVGLTARLQSDDPVLLERATPLLGRARQLREQAASRGIQVVAWNDPRFPAPLLALSDAPPALWYRGRLECLDAPAVAIVGSRAPSAVALETAERLAAGVASHGVTVVSGLARGVDSAAHRGALTAGCTIAVLGSGVARIYPAEHNELATAIERVGLVMSEFVPSAPPLPFQFPMRNRLISGLSRAVVVIEASDRSGSLITAGCALEQGREVMAVPGNVLSGRNKGGHALIRDGAAIVEGPEDVLAALNIPVARAGATGSRTRLGSTRYIDPLLGRMEAGTAYDLDGLAALAGLPIERLLPQLLELEMAGRLRRAEGGRFVRLA